MACVAAFITLLLLSRLANSEKAMCGDVQAECDRDEACKPFQDAYLRDCGQEYTDHSVGCRETCRVSYYKLLSNVIGRRYYRCDCGKGNFGQTCTSFTANLLGNCFGGVFPTPPPVANGSVTVSSTSCKFIRWLCLLDQTCPALNVSLEDACSHAFSGLNCSQTCKQAYSALLQHSIGRRMYGCSCDGDAKCNASETNLFRVCNGSMLLPTDATPSIGTCEAFYEKCFVNDSGTCGSAFTSVNGSCSASIRQQANQTVCPATCATGLKSLVENVAYASDILSCRCMDSRSSMCNTISIYQKLFTFCQVTTPGSYPPTSCEGLQQLCVQYLGAQCGSSLLRVFGQNCSRFFDAQGATDLSTSCTTDCRSSLHELATSPSDQTVLTCSCADRDSFACQNVMRYRPVFEHCDVTAPPPAAHTPTIATTTGDIGGGTGVVINVPLVLLSLAVGSVLLMLF